MYLGHNPYFEPYKASMPSRPVQHHLQSSFGVAGSAPTFTPLQESVGGSGQPSNRGLQPYSVSTNSSGYTNSGMLPASVLQSAPPNGYRQRPQEPINGSGFTGNTGGYAYKRNIQPLIAPNDGPLNAIGYQSAPFNVYQQQQSHPSNHNRDIASPHQENSNGYSAGYTRNGHWNIDQKDQRKPYHPQSQDYVDPQARFGYQNRPNQAIRPTSYVKPSPSVNPYFEFSTSTHINYSTGKGADDTTSYVKLPRKYTKQPKPYSRVALPQRGFMPSNPSLPTKQVKTRTKNPAAAVRQRKQQYTEETSSDDEVDYVSQKTTRPVRAKPKLPMLSISQSYDGRREESNSAPVLNRRRSPGVKETEEERLERLIGDIKVHEDSKMLLWDGENMAAPDVEMTEMQGPQWDSYVSQYGVENGLGKIVLRETDIDMTEVKTEPIVLSKMPTDTTQVITHEGAAVADIGSIQDTAGASPPSPNASPEIVSESVSFPSLLALSPQPTFLVTFRSPYANTPITFTPIQTENFRMGLKHFGRDFFCISKDHMRGVVSPQDLCENYYVFKWAFGKCYKSSKGLKGVQTKRRREFCSTFK